MDVHVELRSAPVLATIRMLAARVGERFPNSGLGKVAAELVEVAQQNEKVIERMRRPLWQVRALTGLTIAALVVLVFWAAIQLAARTTRGFGGLAEVLQATDAATNQLILLTLTLLFLGSLETRIKRRYALRMLHRLRGIAHVVDMHQLTKDPAHALRPFEATASSPARTLTRAQLARYLDYCSELLALTSKLAALHAQHLQDPVVLNAVNDIESLTADLSRNIWQKISLLEPGAPPHAGNPPSV